MRIWVVCIRFIRSHNNHNNRLSRAKVYTHTPLTRFRLIQFTELNLPKKILQKPFRFNLYFNDSNDRRRRRLTVQTAFLLRRAIAG